ncbi:MAG: TolC family protein [Acidobacteriota bacterium]
MRWPYKAISLLAFASFALSGAAQGQAAPSPLTLDAAIAYAKQHSPLLAATKQSVLTKQAAIAAAKAEQLPRADVDAALRGSNQPTESALGFPLTPLADIPNQPFGNGHLTGLATATVPIYTGGRIGAETHVAEAERDLAQTNVHEVESNLEYEVSATYARLVEVERDVQAAQESVDALTESQRIARQMLSVGKIARVDLLKIDTRLADVQAEDIDLENERQILVGQLNALIGRPVDTPIIAQTSLPHPVVTISPDQAALAASTGNTQYQLAEAQTKVAQKSVDQAKSQLRPTISFSADFFKQSTDPFSVYRSGAIAGFSFSYPIFDRPLNHRVQEAKSLELEDRSKADQARLDAMQRARTATLQVQDAEARIQATQSSIAEAREALRIEQEKLKYGRGIMEHLLDAQTALLKSEADYYRALADHTIATASLKRETGQ